MSDLNVTLLIVLSFLLLVTFLFLLFLAIRRKHEIINKALTILDPVGKQLPQIIYKFLSKKD
jgi:hypothetical protein